MLCSACGTNLPDNVTMCTNCGAFLPKADAGADIDNSDAINKMFEAAKNKVDEEVASEMTSEQSDKDSVSEPAYNNTQTAYEISSDPSLLGGATEAPVFDVAPTVVKGDEMSAEQIEAFNSGKPIEFVPGEAEAPPAQGYAPPAPVFTAEEPADEAEEFVTEKEAKKLKKLPKAKKPKPEKKPVAQKQKKPPKPKKAKEAPPPPLDENALLDPLAVMDSLAELEAESAAPAKPEPKPLPEEKETRPIVRILLKIGVPIGIACVSFVLGGLCLFLFQMNTYTNSVYDIAYEAVSAVVTNVSDGKSLIITEAYVKPGSTVTECIIFAVRKSATGEYTATYYRVVTDSAPPGSIKIYNPFDQALYDALKASDSAEDHADAGIMMNSYNDYQRSLTEIKENKYGWKQANAHYIALQLGLG